MLEVDPLDVPVVLDLDDPATVDADVLKAKGRSGAVVCDERGQLTRLHGSCLLSSGTVRQRELRLPAGGPSSCAANTGQHDPCSRKSALGTPHFGTA